jgi:nucleotidyltransferase substrate binding protein (TIGR01987 family)
MTGEPPRWIYRLEHFSRANARLQGAVELFRQRKLSDLEREGLVQRFEYTWELGWKLLRDYLEFSGVALATITPAAVIRAAFAARLIEDGDLWMAALEARNRVAHTYDEAAFDRIVAEIAERFAAPLQTLLAFMRARATEAGHV